MATNAVIGALRVVLGADTAAFDKGLKDADKTLARFNANVTKIGVAIGAGIGTAAVGLTVALGKAINSADELGKSAQKIGIPVEELSKLQHAADLSGVSMESLQASVGRLSRNMADAATNSTTAAARSFTALGISVKNADGSLKSSSEVMAEVAGRFETMRDGAGKTALAMNIFGRSGAELIPLLNAGKSGLNDMMKEAEQLGLVISGPTAKAAEQFNDNMTRLQRVATGVATQVAAELAPSLALLTTRIVEAVKAGGLVPSIASAIVGTFETIIVIAARLSGSFQRMAQEFSAFVEFFKGAATFDKGRMLAAVDAFDAAGNNYRDNIEGIKTSLKNFREEAGMLATHMANTGVSVQTGAAPIIASAKSINDEIRIGQQLFAQYEAQAKTVFENTRTPLEQYGLEIAKISTLLQTGRIDADTWGRAAEQAANKAGFSWSQMVPSIAGSFAEIAQTFGKENKRIAAAAQVFSAFQALVSTYAGSAEALKLPFPLNLAASAAVLAKGLGLVAAIKGFAAPKMATGGMIRMNGFAGPDSQLLQARVRPDETAELSIWRPGEGPDPRRGGSALQEIRVITDEISRPIVEKFLPAMSSLLADRGIEFKVA